MTPKKIVAAAVGLALFAATPATALAQTDVTPTTAVERSAEHPERDIDAVKERALAAIDRRLDRLARLREAVESNDHVTADHAAALLTEYERTDSGLRALADQIRAAQTADELRDLIPRIATDFRVYVLVTPKTWEVLVADTMGDVADRFDEVAAKIADAIDRAEEAGYDVGEARAALEEMESFTAEASRLAGGVAPAVLDLTPADWPALAWVALGAPHDDLVAAREAFRQAKDAAHDAVAALR